MAGSRAYQGGSILMASEIARQVRAHLCCVCHRTRSKQPLNAVHPDKEVMAAAHTACSDRKQREGGGGSAQLTSSSLFSLELQPIAQDVFPPPVS